MTVVIGADKGISLHCADFVPGPLDLFMMYMYLNEVFNPFTARRHSNRFQAILCQGERTKFDRFVDPNVRGAKRRVYSDLRIFCN